MPLPITILPITPDNAVLFRDVRLRALQSDPTAFGSAYANESQLDDAGWIERVRQWGTHRAGWLALNGEDPCGMIAVAPDENLPHTAQIFSMWVAPEIRNTGVGRALINTVKAWAAERRFSELRLMVTSINLGAIEFYLCNGFSMTGNTAPYPNNATLFEYEMACLIAAESNPPNAQ